ncbi:MAG: magnesium transporter [Spirochaetes bacterium]|nr:magnesium transporter [Spirochaetota bacterium]
MLDQLIAPDIRAAIKNGEMAAVLDYFREAHPADAAEVLAGLAEEEAVAILKQLETEIAADIFCELPGDLQADLAELMPSADIAELVSELSPDDMVDTLKTLPEELMADVVLALEPAEQAEVQQLVDYAEGTAGSIMTTEFIALPGAISAAQAIERLRSEAADKESVYNSYVVDSHRKLLGVITLRDLILSQPESLLRDFMDDQVASVQADSDSEEAIHTLSRYDLVELPVVTESGMLIGLITHDDAMDAMQREHTEDMERFMGISGVHEDSSYLRTSVWSHFKHRVVWLVILTALGLVSGFVIQGFQDMLSTLIILSFYMPMLVATGGNTGSQSATMVVRALALKEIATADVWRVVWKELRVALMLSVVLGALAFARVWFFTGTAFLPAGIGVLDVSFAITLALAVQVVSSMVVGALLPIGVSRLGVDPALVASPALATIVDISGLLSYFSIARLVLGI